MNTKITVLFVCVVLIVLPGRAQSTFQNLGFESATVPDLPAGQYGGYVSSTQAIPAWTVYLGTDQVTQVLQNNITLGTAAVGLLGPNWTASMGIGFVGGIIESNYSVVLQAGQDPFSLRPAVVNASISQVGLVPANAQSLQLKTAGTSYGIVSVSFAGQNLPLVALETSNPNYTLYGANISAFAGQSGALTFTASTAVNPDNTAELDSIVFSTQSIPEPGGLALFGVGGLLLGFFCRRISLR